MKNLFLAIACVALSIPTFSQVKVSPGVKVGLNNSSISNFDDASSKTGIYGGLFLNLHLSDVYELQFETMYSSQGAKANYYYYDYFTGNTIVEKDKEAILDYVSIGIANKIFIIRDLGLNLIIGPSIDIKVNDNFDNEETSPLDLAFFGGIGYEFPFGLGIEARYKQGIIDIDDGFTTIGGDSEYEDDNNLNSVIQIGVSYRFNFRR